MKWDKSDIGKEYHKKYNKKYRGTHKKYFRLSQKKYYLTHRDYYKIKSIEHYNKFRFGGLRGLVLERDGYKCLHCGMTDVEHRKIWGRSITIDHIDGFGRYSKIKHNTMENLQILCLSCHGKKDIKRRYIK